MKTWYSGCGRISLEMTQEQAESVSHSGDCEADVLTLMRLPEIKLQLVRIDSLLLAKVLDEFGCWDDLYQTGNRQENLKRLVWIAGCDIAEEIN